ncbi:Tetraspanin-36 [Merluccius polli]|uniref:Tetraspanin n=1 Tax=Merluccius polli TaxID=89951 RepID=A0AA47MUV7_MERPO|nr:Tetraspanin-36 [Merluccius polli]
MIFSWFCFCRVSLQVAGAVLAFVGVNAIRSYNNFHDFLENRYVLIPAVIIICVALVMFFLGLLGCCSTLRESTVGLNLFLIVILVLFAAEVTALAFCFIYQGKINGELQSTMSDVFMKYDGQNPDSGAVDILQEALQCCGVYNQTSWVSTPWFSGHNQTVPLSCCRNQTDHQCTGRLEQPELIYTEGCLGKLNLLLQNVLSYTMLVILGFAIVKFFGMLSVCVITCKGTKRSGYHPIYA